MLSQQPSVRRIAVAALFVVMWAVAALPAAAESLRLMTYNILNYNSGRTTEFQTALADIDCDILVVEEVLSQSGVNNFLTTVLDVLAPGEYAAGDFVNGPDTDNGIYYKTATVDYIGHHVIGTTLRDIDEWTVRPKGYGPSADFRIYAVHLKASSGSTNEQRRLTEVQAMRTRMETFPAGGLYTVLGDFNIYDSGEPAYSYMLGSGGGANGIVEDPIDMPGGWHTGPAFAAIHTQSPRTTQFGGGANGGMDDRFDMILTSPALLDGSGFEVIPSSYTAYGQDGLHYNVALTDPPANQVVSAEVAQALHDASDHLPVYTDFILPALLVADASIELGTVIVGGSSEDELSVENIACAGADDFTYVLTPPTGVTAPAGTFTAVAGDGPNLHTITLDSSAAGAFSGDLIVDSDSDDLIVPVSATVLDHAMPSVIAGVVETEAVVDFGNHDEGEFTDQVIDVHNVDYGALQALLDVYDAALTGDARFSIIGGFSPVVVDGTPAMFTIAFDDVGGEGVYTGTLTLSTRDQQDLSGATDLAPLTYSLTAEVGTVVSSPSDSPAILAGFNRVFPNPFRPATSIRYGLTSPGKVRLDIFDVAGRRVRSLIDGAAGVGTYEVRWDGRDDASHTVSPGIYYLRLSTPEVSQTQRVVRIR